MTTFNAHFLSWVYGSDDDPQRDGILARFQSDIKQVGPDRMHTWFAYALIGEGQSQDFVSVWRRKLHSRAPERGLHTVLLDLFYSLAVLPSFRDCLEESNVHVKTPVLWIMKVLQRTLCTRTNDDWIIEMVYSALGGVMYVTHLCGPHQSLT